LEWDADQGPTDIDNLVPICKHHHDLIHDNGWKLSLSPDRRLTITYPDGTTMTTGPPSEQWE
ncbi:MAG: HNH endonuclease signature motif containing protein, partial [Ilumatobacteraceae bacterium]